MCACAILKSTWMNWVNMLKTSFLVNILLLDNPWSLEPTKGCVHKTWAKEQIYWIVKMPWQHNLGRNALSWLKVWGVQFTMAGRIIGGNTEGRQLVILPQLSGSKEWTGNGLSYKASSPAPWGSISSNQASPSKGSTPFPNSIAGWGLSVWTWAISLGCHWLCYSTRRF